jgi:hypothetical protein
MLPHYLQGGSNPTNKTEEEKVGTCSGTKETEEGTSCGGNGL